ncbi:MAG: ATP cone domain-containing protein [Patescibacteria group bacterium]|nr:ATP cone domain-containing protein [Patescibacteria group bacterium]
MAQEVIKKNGSRQPFDTEKLRRSIEDAMSDAGMEQNSDTVNSVAGNALAIADNKDIITTAELKAAIIEGLTISASAAAEAWKKYEASRNTPPAQ